MIEYVLQTVYAVRRRYRLNIYTYTPDSFQYVELYNELMFNIATARASGCELAIFSYAKSNEKIKKRITNCRKILRLLKGRGMIQLYIQDSELDATTTVAEYVRNKYPDIKSLPECSDGDYTYIFIKI